MLVVVTGVSSLVHVYSIGYMARRPVDAALLRLSLPVHLLHADAGDGRQLPAAVLRLGRGGPLLLPADRLLVRPAVGQCRRDQGLHRQPRRRFRLRARHHGRVLRVRLGRLRRPCSPPRRRWPARRIDFLGMQARHADDALPAAVHRRHGQVGAARPAHLAARRDGGPDAGLRADPCRHHGDGRRVHGLPAVADVRATRRSRSRSSPSSARSTAFFAATIGLVPERHQARHRLFDLQPARLHVLRRRRLGLSAPRCSTSSPTPSSRRCCSSARARSSTPCRTSRTCARWAASGG